MDCKIKSVIGIINEQSGKIDPNSECYFRNGETALIEIECDKDICVNKFSTE